jgi:hypothetical protein
LPSFLAASINAGVTVLAGGAAALTEVAKAAPAASAVEAFRMSRLDNSGFFFTMIFSRSSSSSSSVCGFLARA